MAAVNFRRIKVKKRMTSNVRNELKFGKICKEVILYTKMQKKMNINNLIVVAL